MEGVFDEIRNYSEKKIQGYIRKKEDIEQDKYNSYKKLGSGYLCTCSYCSLSQEVKSNESTYECILEMRVNEIKYHSRSIWENLHNGKPEELRGVFLSFYQNASHAMHTFNIQFKSEDELKLLDQTLQQKKMDRQFVQDILAQVEKNIFKDEFLFVLVISDLEDLDIDTNCLYRITPIHKDTCVAMRKVMTESNAYCSFEDKMKQISDKRTV